MVRLKQCECALSDGLLDEAFELARQPDLRAHRRGQELAGKVVAAFVERGRDHLGAGRLFQASADCEKAALLGGNMGDVAQLRIAVNHAMQARDRANHEFGKVLATARRHADLGQLTVGEKILLTIEEPDGRVDGLKHELAARRLAVQSSLTNASDALADGNWEAAIDMLAPLRRGHAQNAELRELCGKIAAHVEKEIAAAFEAGRLNVASALLRGLDRLPVQSVETDHLKATLDQCHLANNAIESGRPQDAEDTLRRLCSLWPNAAWLKQAAQSAKELGDAFSTMRASPLSLVGMSPDTSPRLGAVLPRTERAVAPAATSTAGSFCLHVDGIGSFQVFPNSAVTIGPAGSSRTVDVPLMLDAGVPTITILRTDDDYFLRSGSENSPSAQSVAVNGNRVTNKLLSNGDHIGLGSRGRITFRRPSAASNSAVLDLSGTRLPGSSIRQLLLMDREIIIGPGSTAHIRVDDLAAPIVLQSRSDGLFCRSAAEITVDDRPAGMNAQMPIGGHVSVGSLRFVVAAASNSAAREPRS